MRGGTLTLRLTAVMLVGFVLIQFVLLAITGLPERQGRMPYNLPTPAAVAAMTQALDAAPPERRAGLLEAFGGSLYRARIAADMPSPGTADPILTASLPRYRSAIPDRTIRVSGATSRFPRLARIGALSPRPSSPATLAVSLADGEALVIERRTSGAARAFLRRRALLAAIGALVMLAALVLAVRAMTRPIVRLSRSIGAFADRLEAPDLPVEGSREMRELATAYNAMKGRIAGLVAERTRLLAAIAHDMRTYLTRLRLRADYIGDDEQRAKAAADLDEMAALLDDSLLFAKGVAAPDTVPIMTDLATELEALVAIRREMGEDLALRITVRSAISGIRPLALRRIVGNLLDNALRHGTHVAITLEPGPDGYRISVIDEGPGVPPDFLGRLGQPFARLDPSRDRTTGGAGLGLAIVRGLVEQHGGSVAFANRPEGGFVATVLLHRPRQ